MRPALAVLATLAILWSLRSAAMVAIPFTAALLAALTVAPISASLQRRLPKIFSWLGPIVATLIVVAVVIALLFGLSIAAGQIVTVAPALITRAGNILQNGGSGSLLDPEQLRTLAAQLMEPAVAFAQGALATAASVTTGLVLMIFLLLLMLIEGPTWRSKIETLSGRQPWMAALRETGLHLRRFLLTRLLLGAITGVLYVAWLSFFGVDLLLTWGMLALLLNFIPNIGSIIAGALPAIYVALTRDPGTALAVAAGLLGIEQVMGNYIDPKVMGKQLELSPLVVLLSMLVWTWMWGPVGALLSTPLMALIADLCRAVPPLYPVALVLGEGPEQDGKPRQG